LKSCAAVLRDGGFFLRSFGFLLTARRLLTASSSRRRPGSSAFTFASSLVGRFARTDSRPCAVSSAFLADESLSLSCARESNQREHTLGVAPARSAGALRAAGVSQTGHPALQRNERDPSRSPARGARGPIRPPFAAPQRDPRSKAESKNALLCLGFCGQDGRALAPTGPSRPRRGRAGKSPKGRAHDARAFAVRPGMACQRTSGASSRRRRARCPATAAVWVPFSWLLLFGQAKRSDPLARTASG